LVTAVLALEQAPGEAAVPTGGRLMYLTAHRILAPSGETGINAFLHGHGKSPLPSLEQPNAIALVADTLPGDILAHVCDVKPGGNRVLSFIDIVAADDCPLDAIGRALDDLGNSLPAASLPVSNVGNGIGVRFGANFGLYDALGKEYRDLAQRALALLAGQGVR
jgi:hypothetical protein